jgi:heterodisulfide reductase subunit C
MQVFRQDKKRFLEFLNKLRQSYELIAPVKKDLVRFERIEKIDDIYLKNNSYFPLKEYFFKKQETLFRFDEKKITMPRLQKPSRVFFGIRKCDLNAIKHQDAVFTDDVKDPYYKAARQNSYLLGLHCQEACSQYCFCGSLEFVDFFDLMFYEKRDYFLVEVGSEKGKFIVEKFKAFFEHSNDVIRQQDKQIEGSDRLEKKDISQLYDNPNWKKGVDRCFSCSACTTLCPTCYCFEIYDEVITQDLKRGERKRQWSSCQLQEFTRVAGDHVFREAREARFKHRIYHQLQYFKEKYGTNLCVGCGRCIEGCPTRIDFVQIINEMPKCQKPRFH